MKLNDAIEEWLKLERAKRAKATALSREYTVRRLMAHTGNIEMKRLTPAHLEDFFYGEDGLADRMVGSSFNTALTAVRVFVRFAEARRYCKSGLLRNVENKKTDYRERMRLSAVELLALLEHAELPRDRFALALAMNTACRANELKQLRLRDVDLDNSVIYFKITKSRTEDAKPITLDLREEINRWLAVYRRHADLYADGKLNPDWFLVPSQYAPGFGAARAAEAAGTVLRPTLSPAAPSRIVKRALESAGFPTHQEGFHTIRRSVARIYFETLLDMGYDGALRAVMALLNHKNTMVTERYLGLSQEKQRRDTSLRDKPFLTAVAEQQRTMRIQPVRAVDGV